MNECRVVYVYLEVALATRTRTTASKQGSDISPMHSVSIGHVVLVTCPFRNSGVMGDVAEEQAEELEMVQKLITYSTPTLTVAELL